MQPSTMSKVQTVPQMRASVRSAQREGVRAAAVRTSSRPAPSVQLRNSAVRSLGHRAAPKGLFSNRTAVSTYAVAVPAQPTTPETPEFDPSQEFSGLEGRALRNAMMEYPPKREILSKIPEECFKRDTAKSLFYAFLSTAMTAACGILGYMYIPMTLAWTPAWIAYAAVTGTVATGCWVVAHECGHGAFSDNKMIQDTVGYILHSLLLVPYFSWQRSHAVHHSRTNHMDEGETHVPSPASKDSSQVQYKIKDTIGEEAFVIVHAFINLVLGWPLYLLKGASGGPVRGNTNHFYPYAGATGRHALFPGQWAGKVWLSDIGIAAVLGGLAYWAYVAGPMTVMALYVGPYIFTNAWLVGYTWLQHTDVDVPHFDGDNWDWSKGTFMTIDRPYGALIDFLHHRIGSTHVAHHLNHQIPHYHALKATNAIKEAYPQFYLYDPTPIHKAVYRIAAKCIAVVQVGNMWVWRSKSQQTVAA